MRTVTRGSRHELGASALVALMLATSSCGNDNAEMGAGGPLAPAQGANSTSGAAGAPDASQSSPPAVGSAAAGGDTSTRADAAAPSGNSASHADAATRAEAGASADAGAATGADAMTMPSTGMEPPKGAPVCDAHPPAEFKLNSVGGGGAQHQDSGHFALYGASDPSTVLNFMEAAHTCFVEDWCFRTPGLPVKSDVDGPYYKTNIYSKATMSAGGLTYWDESAGLSYLNILASQVADPRTTVHEYGHAITMSEYNWINQKRTGFWWETVANWVAYSFLTSPYCERARDQFKIKPATTIIDGMHTLTTVYNQSYTVICNDQNYYQVWPFLTYLTNNPDRYPGLGKMAVADLMRKYQRNSNETPLHTLERIAAPVKVQTILGRYWARMAYMDIELPVGQKDFLGSRSTLKFGANWDASGAQTYTVKAARRPQYGGANIQPLKPNGGAISVAVTNLGNGLKESNFTATLAIHAQSGTGRYVDLPGGKGEATIASDEEVSLVVVNTPDTLYQFDPQYVGSPENVGLNYKVELTGATPAN